MGGDDSTDDHPRATCGKSTSARGSTDHVLHGFWPRRAAGDDSAYDNSRATCCESTAARGSPCNIVHGFWPRRAASDDSTDDRSCAPLREPSSTSGPARDVVPRHSSRHDLWRATSSHQHGLMYVPACVTGPKDVSPVSLFVVCV